ncbi:MAG: ABC transporter ATP-binding protein [Candidatus Rokubacteria bacterium]|nr:ABC transporter ATP-binding protein [Candidatus Rokubacteria bacterium]
MLELRGVSVAYGAVQALSRVSLTVLAGQITAIVGANGAGKSTCLRAISGLVAPAEGEILFDGMSLTGVPAERRRALGIAHVMEGRRLFRDQTVHENLVLGAYSRLRRGDKRAVGADIETMYERFPALAEKRGVIAAALSGGQQQMLVIAMALMCRPKLLLLDEPSLGLAPKLVETVFRLVAELQRAGQTTLLVEQMASLGLAVASVGYVFERGRVVGEGPSSELLRGEIAGRLSEIYLGRAGAERG